MQIWIWRSRSNRFTSSASLLESAKVSTRLRHGKSTTASPALGSSHQGEPGRGASSTKLRNERSAKIRCACSSRGAASGSGSSCEVSIRRPRSPGCIRTKHHSIGTSSAGIAGEAPQLLALGPRTRVDADPPAAHEHQDGRADRLRVREERAVLQPQLEVLEAERHAVRAPGMARERHVHEPVHDVGLRPADERPTARAQLGA